IGLSHWKSEEKDAFFSALCTLSRDDTAGIAAAVGSKSEIEVYDYELLLRQGMVEAHLNHPKDHLLMPTEVLAAAEIGGHCQKMLDSAADSLARKQWQHEAREEQRKHGDYWRLDQEFARKLEQERPHKRHETKPTEYAGDPSSDSQPAEDDSVKPSSTSSLLRKVPAAALLRIERWLDISQNFFMNQALPQNETQQRTFIDGGQGPSIMHTAFADFHTLTIALTRRLVQVSLFQAMSRLRTSKNPKIYGKVEPTVIPDDVRAALQTLGMSATSEEFWATAARRNRLTVINVPALRKHDRKIYVHVKQLMEESTTHVIPSPEAVYEYLQEQAVKADEAHRLRLADTLRWDRRTLNQSIKRSIAFAAYKLGLSRGLSYDVTEQELRRSWPRRRSRSLTAESTDSESARSMVSDVLDPMIGFEWHDDAADNGTPPDQTSDTVTDSDEDSIMDSIEPTHHEVAEDMYLELYDQHNSKVEEQEIMETLGLRDYHAPGNVPRNVLARLTAERKESQDLADWRDHVNYMSLWESRLLDGSRKHELSDQSDETESSDDEEQTDDHSQSAQSGHLQRLNESDRIQDRNVQGIEQGQNGENESPSEDEQLHDDQRDVEDQGASVHTRRTQATRGESFDQESLENAASSSESGKDSGSEAHMPNSPPLPGLHDISVDSNDEADDRGRQEMGTDGEQGSPSNGPASEDEATDSDSDARSRPNMSLPQRPHRTVSRGRSLPSAAFDLSD
ncbi:hypothetical protein LTS18_004005, partial [Coniosporium uncinatum]